MRAERLPSERLNAIDQRLDRRELPAYTLHEAARYLGVSGSTLRSWFVGQHYVYRDRPRQFRRVIDPAQAKPLILSFSNLVEAYVLAAIRRHHKISLPRTRRALSYLSKKFGSRRPLLDSQLAAHGPDLFMEHLGQIINLSRDGQVEIAELIRVYLKRVERDAEGAPIKLYPLVRAQPVAEQPRTVVIDPTVSFGRPVLVGTGIPTAVLAEQFKAGDRPADLARAYGAEEQAVWDSIRCELDLEAA